MFDFETIGQQKTFIKNYVLYEVYRKYRHWRYDESKILIG